MPATTFMETLAASGAQFGEYAGARTPASFGSPAAELEALRSGGAVYDLAWRGKLVITGEDRIRWMNGVVTNNIRDLAAHRGNFNYVLNPQGRIQGDCTVYQRGDHLLLLTEQSQLARLKEYFDRYIIMDDVEVTDVSEKLSSLGVAGPKAAVLLGKAGLLPQALEPGEVIDAVSGDAGYSIARSPIERADGYELWFAVENYKHIWDKLVSAGASRAGSTALEWRRILLGLPRVGLDIGERELPQETGQDYALHYAKGCYIGQEIVERIHSRGIVHRVFSGFVIQGPAPEPGSKLSAVEKEVGKITSSAEIPMATTVRCIALGYLRREAAAPGTELQVGETTATVTALPFKV